MAKLLYFILLTSSVLSIKYITCPEIRTQSECKLYENCVYYDWLATGNGKMERGRIISLLLQLRLLRAKAVSMRLTFQLQVGELHLLAEGVSRLHESRVRYLPVDSRV